MARQRASPQTRWAGFILPVYECPDTRPQNRINTEKSIHGPRSRRAEAFPATRTRGRVLMVWPRFPASYWSLGEVTEIVPERSLVPPLGLITVAALCPKQWAIRLVDLAFEELSDEDLLWADLVMVSAMQVQREMCSRTLQRASKLGRRTMIGGPYASSEPEALLPLADHVVVGEPDEVFQKIAADIEVGSARRLYRVTEKPDVSRTPVPRFDLLALEKYALMAVQFSRGCPFTCEFCDIITLYGRRPRTKSPTQLIGELDRLLQLGWRKEVFIVDDNFIGNHKAALELARELERWQLRNRYPFGFAPKLPSILLRGRNSGGDGQGKFLSCVHRNRNALSGVAEGSEKISESPPGPVGLHTLYSTAGALGHGRFYRRF